MTGLTTLVQFRILRDGGDHLEFSNDLVRAHAYYAVPSPMRFLLHGLIADVLLKRAASGDDSLGLEIAWHCMRCGRKEEATTHLLLGARASIRRGAVHEAERRLESGLSSLPAGALKEARLLLVELLQEQGRWKESATLLSGFIEEAKTPDGILLAGRATVEALEATRREASDLALLANTCIADTLHGPQTRLRALRLAGAVVCAQPCFTLASAFLASARRARPGDWSADDELEWDTQLVYIGHYAQHATEESEDTFTQLVSIADRAQARTIANARSYRILSGLALCHRRAGRYRDAIREYEAALDILNRLGRRFSLSVVHAHLAACYRELGQVDEQRLHGEKAIALSEVVEYSRLLAAYCVAEARHINGDKYGAERLIEAEDRTVSPHIEGYLLQAWTSFKADMLWLAARRDLAWMVAQQAVDAASDAPLSRSTVGCIGRWAAVLSTSGRHQSVETLRRIQAVQGSTWWDEAQRLSALNLLEGKEPRAFSAARLKEAKQRLPLAFQAHLVRYGLV
jgi:tetratricopeptide (TPR) repeat protein